MSMTAQSRRFAFWGAFGALLAGGLLFAFWPRALVVDLVDVQRGTVVVTVDDEGQTRVHDVYVLSAPVIGNLRRIELHAGDPVTPLETVLAQIAPIDAAFLDPRSEAQARADIRAAEAAEALARAEVEQAEAELQFAQRSFGRSRELIRQNLVAQQEADETERAYRTRRAALTTTLAAHDVRVFQLERARAQLLSPSDKDAQRDSCACIALRSPVAGRILRILQQSEGVVTAGAAIMEVGDPRDLEIVVDLLSADAVRVAPGQRVIIERWGGDQALEGRVRIVEPFGFTKVSALGIEEQRVNVVIDLVSPPAAWERLAHGYQVDVRIVLSEAQNVPKLPLTALFRDGDDWAVFAAARGRAQLRHVEIGRSNGIDAEIVAGVAEGDRVVLHPSDRVVDGARVAARSSAP